MKKASHSPIALAFLQQYLTDQANGEVQELSHYQQRFAGYEELIADEFARLRDAATSTESEHSDPLSGQLIGHYRLLHEIGRGGQGVVYQAKDERLGRVVAVKILTGLATLSEEALSRFRREAETGSRLDHPGICTVYDLGWHDSMPFLAMAYIEGESLASQLATPSTPDVAARLLLFERAANALHAAHEAGIVHRDIKPANLMIRPDGQPVVLDFGVARVLEAEGMELTLSGTVLGTPAYLSPEQVEAVGPVDHRTDVYSLGVALFETLAGERPFTAPTQAGLFQQILRDAPPSVRSLNGEVSSDVAVVVATALSKHLDHRYQTCADFAEDLRRARLGMPILARATPTLTRVRLWAGRNRGWFLTMMSAAVLLLSAAVVAIIYATQATSALSRVRLLADKFLFDELTVRALRDTYPAVPSRLPRMAQWLAQAEDLLLREPLYYAALAELRSQARLVSDDQGPLTGDARKHNFVLKAGGLLSRRASIGAVPTHGSPSLPFSSAAYRFDNDEDQLLHDTLGETLVACHSLQAEETINSFAIAGVRHRQALARELQDRIPGEDATAWGWCQQQVRAAGSPYAGLELQAIPGLVPLGIDRDSGLMEFWHVASGERPTWEGTSLGVGRVVLDESSGREGLVMVLLPGGTFQMGDEQVLGAVPVESVSLHPFFISKYEATIGQCGRLYGNVVPGSAEASRQREPVGEVNWAGVVETCRRWDLVLPTNAQWEYACRAGSQTAFHTGNFSKSTIGYGNAGRTNSSVFGLWDDGFDGVAPVGSLKPNAFSLFDMHGNVGEWCWDIALAYEGNAPRPGDGMRGIDAQATHRVCRRGSWQTSPKDLRSGSWHSERPVVRAADLGFRPARDLQLPR